MSDIFGRYYNYSDAKAVCSSLPGGEWKLPTNKDWDELNTYIKGQIGTGYSTSIASALMGNATFNGILMWEYWSNVGDINNASGFSAIPVGYATFDTCNDNETDYSKASFSGVYEYAAFWADADDENDTPTCRYLFCDQTELFSYQADTLTFGASVRCIKKK